MSSVPTSADYLNSMLRWHFPKDIAKMIADEWDWDTLEAETKSLQTSLNREIVAGGPGIREFWFGGLDGVSRFYCCKCGGHKSPLRAAGIKCRRDKECLATYKPSL